MGAEQTEKVEDLVPIDTLPFDEFELGLLAVLRHFSKSYTVPENQTWQHAYLIAAERWGERIGLSTAYALMKVIQGYPIFIIVIRVPVLDACRFALRSSPAPSTATGSPW